MVPIVPVQEYNSNPDEWQNYFMPSDNELQIGEMSSDEVPYADYSDQDINVDKFISQNKGLNPQLNQQPDQLQPTQVPTQPPAQGNQFSQVSVTQRFGNPNARLYGRDRRGRANINRGLDVAKKPGQAQYAPSEGKWVVESAYNGNKFNTGWGRSVVLKNVETGERIRRSHLDKVYAQPGQVVSGKPIGTTGRTGRTTGYHADIEYMTPQGKLSDYSKTRYFREEGRI